MTESFFTSEWFDFCKENEITMIDEFMNLSFLTDTKPNARGMLIGYKEEKFAVFMGPEIRKIFLVSQDYLIKNVYRFAEKCKYFCIKKVTSYVNTS